MRKYIYIISVILAMAASLIEMSAAGHKGKAFCFVYVAVSDATSEKELTDYLDLRYKKALADEDYVLVMYLSNGEEPYVVEVNTASDNRDGFSEFLEELRNGDLDEVNPAYDRTRLAAIFDRLDVVSGEDDEVMYDSVDWHFHVTSDFWKMGYNESLISSLCFVMGVDHLQDANFRLRCYFSRNDEFEYDQEYPFGKKNFCNLDFRPYYY